MLFFRVGSYLHTNNDKLLLNCLVCLRNNVLSDCHLANFYGSLLDSFTVTINVHKLFTELISIFLV